MKPYDCMLISLNTFEEHVMYLLSINEWFDVGSPVDVYDGVCLFKHANDVWTMVCVKILSCWQHSVSMFVGIISGKPSRDFTHPLGSLRGLKDLLHMLNAIVSPTKEDLCFMLWFCFSFFLAKGLAKCKFVGIWWVPKKCIFGPLNLH
jgi:hypothetical protein